MAYKLRDRKQDKLYREISSSESESESEPAYQDPDYSNRTARRRRRRQLTGNVSNPNMNGAARSVVRRRPGRPPRNTAPAPAQDLVPNEQIPRRRRGPHSLQKTLGTINKTPESFRDKRETKAVHYFDEVKEKITVPGEITRAGIICRCCGEEVSASDSEVHARSHFGNAPHRDIQLRNGRYLLQHQAKSWSDGQGEPGCILIENFEPEASASDKSDDACIVCADGGKLICCENCPSTFHFSCLNMEGIPTGSWYCPYCVCKHCELSEGTTEDFSKCIMCGKKYHFACFAQKELNLNTNCSCFCGQNCQQVYEKLKEKMGVKNELDGGFSWTLVRHRDLFSALQNVEDLYSVIECNSKIAMAWTMMNQSFNTIIDRHTKINVVQNVLYNTGSNLTRIDFRGFCTAILEKNDEVICAASLRLHGKKMAEMPFVATNSNYRNKGMLKKLLVAIESALHCMEVENLVLPSAEEVVTMWKNKFHFSTIPKDLEEDVIRSNMLMFPHSVKLHKTLFSGVAAMEIDQLGDDDTKGVVPESSSKTKPLFDLNLLPTEEEEEDEDVM